jgi:hypothetical protein
MNFHFFPERQYTENRELAKAPQWNLNALSRFPADCESYVGDNFGLRPELIRWDSILKVKLLGVSPVRSVVLGKESWLFYCSEALDDGNTFNDFRGTIPLSSAELEKVQKKLEDNTRMFERMSILYLAVVVPNKNTLYDEYLPDDIRRFRPVTRLDQLVSHLKEHSNVKILDLRDAFRKAKNSHPLYWKTDSHWNSYGAYLGYSEIVRTLSARLPALRSIPIAGGKVRVETSPNGRDLAQMLSMQDMLPEENETEFSLDASPDTPLLDTIVFRHDSFGDNLYPYFRRHFKNIVNIAPFAPYQFDAIRDQHPEVVLHVFAERYIPQALQDDFFYREEKS